MNFKEAANRFLTLAYLTKLAVLKLSEQEIEQVSYMKYGAFKCYPFYDSQVKIELFFILSLYTCIEFRLKNRANYLALLVLQFSVDKNELFENQCEAAMTSGFLILE